MQTLLPTRLLRLARIDRAVGYTLLNRVWILGSNAITMLLIVHFFSGQQQGLYFTFLTLLGLHTVFDVGVSFSVTQWVARAGAELADPPGARAALADGPARTRVALLATTALRQTAALATLFLAFTLCLGAWLFANDVRVARGAWLAPWILVTLLTALRLPLLTLEGVLEGLGRVGFVAQVRLAGLIAGTLALWTVVACGGGLYGMAASAALTVLVPALAYARRYAPLLRVLFADADAADAGFSWRREVWPFQWKYAATLLTGLLVANLFNPAVYYFRGAEAAGQFGLGMSIAQAVAGFMSVWLNCKVPQIAALGGAGRQDELRALFRATKQSAAAVALLAGCAALLLLKLLTLVDPALGARIPPAATLLVLLAAAVLQQTILTVAVFARAQAREPLLAPSLLSACATPCLLALLVPRHGALGAALGYLLPVVLIAAPFAWAANRRIAGAPPVPDAGARKTPTMLRRLLLRLRALYALRHWRGHLKLTRLMAHPCLARLVWRRPRTLFKYLHGRYLMVGLEDSRRLAILTHHYTRLVRQVNAARLRVLLSEGVPAWRLADAEVPVEITLSFPHHDLEGELRLMLLVNGVRVYYMTVTLAPAGALEPDCAPALLVTCMQGRVGMQEQIRAVTRVCANVQPPYLLLAAARGVAAAFGVEHIVGVGNARQLNKTAGSALFDYDQFWTGLGGAIVDAGLYRVPVQPEDKPLESIPSKHRGRTARSRELRRAIADAVVHCLRQPHA